MSLRHDPQEFPPFSIPYPKCHGLLGPHRYLSATLKGPQKILVPRVVRDNEYQLLLELQWLL